MLNPRANKLTTIAFTALAVVLALSIGACRKSEAPKSKLGLDTPAAAGSGAIAVSGTASDSPAQKAETSSPAQPPAPGSPAPNTGGTNKGPGSGSNGSSNGGTKKPPADPVIVEPTAGIPIKILWWNDTADNAPEGFEVTYGKQSFKPNITQKRAEGSIGPCPYGTTVSLTVYPDGRSGPKFVVPFTVTKPMEANSERDAIHVQVSDGSVRVLGNAVDNFEQTTKR